MEIELEAWDDLFHVWHYYADWIPEGREAIERIAAFRTSGLVCKGFQIDEGLG